VPLHAGDVTVAEVLKQAGYTTGITGKWGLGEPGTSGPPNRQGFDEWFGYLNQRRAHSYYPEFLWNNEQRVTLDANLNGGRGDYAHDRFTDFALQFVREQRDGPFFLYLAYTVPHAKYEIPSVEPYEDRPWSDNAKVHAAMITRMDRDVGKFMALLKELEIDDKTIVFFCSDNGAAQRWEGTFDSSGALRGHKRDMYEGGIRTPMIVRWPGRVAAGTVSDAVWYFADFLPTAADLAGVDSPTGIDGVSVLPTLLGKKQSLDDRFLYWEFFERGFRQAARHGNWKAIRPGIGKPLELYDLNRDQGETEDLAARHPEVVKIFEEYLQTARTESEAWPLEKR
jgi:arylsulfatase A-like enzyme